MTAVFSDAFKNRLADGKYTRWAEHIDEETLRLVLWFVGEYAGRGGLHRDPPHHGRTLGASRVLVELHRGNTLSFQQAIDIMNATARETDAIAMGGKHKHFPGGPDGGPPVIVEPAPDKTSSLRDIIDAFKKHSPTNIPGARDTRSEMIIRALENIDARLLFLEKNVKWK